MKRILVCLPALLAVAAGALPGAARTEYRCAKPQFPADLRACELARTGPDQLRRFVDLTRAIYRLNFYDYVNEADLARWDAERGAADNVARNEAGRVEDPRTK